MFRFLYLLQIIFVIVLQANADVVSTTSVIRLDAQNDGVSDMTITSEGMGLGTNPSANLHVLGNAIVSNNIEIGGITGSSTNLFLNGSLAISAQTINSSQTLTGESSLILADTQGTGNIVLQLPAAADHTGKLITFKKIFSGNDMILEAISRIDKDYSLAFSDGGQAELISNGIYWYIISMSDSNVTRTSQSNLQLHFDFESDLLDTSNQGNHGSSSGNTYENLKVSGPIESSAIAISELNDVIDAGNSSTLDFSEGGTISLWLKPNSTDTGHQSFSGWTSLTAPTGPNNYECPGDVAFTLIGNTIAYLSYQHSNNTEIMEYALSDRSFNGLSWTATTTADGTQRGEASSISLDSDGKKVYAVAVPHTNEVERLWLGSYDDDFTNFSGWTYNNPPDGAGGYEPSYVDWVVVDSNISLAAFLHNGTNESVSVARTDTSFSGNLSWSSPAAASTIDNSGSGGETSSVGIDSNGQNLYYAFFTTNTNGEAFYIASSDLDGSNFSVNQSSTGDPDGAVSNYSSHVATSLVGNKLHFTVALSNYSGVEVFTAMSNLDGTGLTTFVSRGTVTTENLGATENCSLDMLSTGTNIHILSWSGNTDYDYLKVGTLELDNAAPVIKKGDAFSLNYSGGGLVFDWAGSPKSFGTLTTSSFHHLVMSHDGSTMKFYLDGSLVRTQTVSRDFLTSSSNLLIGGDESRYFDGSIDDVRIFNRGLSASEIGELYQLGQD